MRFLQINQAEYTDITFALDYTIRELEMLILNSKTESKHFNNILASLKETERYITDFWNTDDE